MEGKARVARASLRSRNRHRAGWKDRADKSERADNASGKEGEIAQRFVDDGDLSARDINFSLKLPLAESRRRGRGGEAGWRRFETAHKEGLGTSVGMRGGRQEWR